jgi:hypothetical protein
MLRAFNMSPIGPQKDETRQAEREAFVGEGKSSERPRNVETKSSQSPYEGHLTYAVSTIDGRRLRLRLLRPKPDAASLHDRHIEAAG